MKLTTIFLFAACLHVSAKGVSQTVNLSEKDAPLQKVIKAIEAQTDYVFFYKTSWLQQAKRITIKAENIPLKEALDLCFKGQPLSYVISGKNITIEPREEKPVEELTIDISGRITDKEGNPLVGANVKIKGTNTGTTTNGDGSFLLKAVDENSVLEVSYVGFETAFVSLQGRSSLIINLNPKNSFLDETIVIAYGTTTKRLSTGNVSSVKATDIEKQPVNNPLLALQGRVPGLVITQTSGLSGAGIVVRIQGQNSLTNGNAPLYVVDGVPFPAEVPTPPGMNFGPLGNSGERAVRLAPTGRGSALSFINPGNIESMEILKDADATAIYGSRAANGAILITTKKGKAGKTKVDVNLQQGWGKVTRTMDLLNTKQYLEMRNEAYKNDGLQPSNDPSDMAYAPDLLLWDTTRSTDWQKTLIGETAHYTNISGSVSGGTQFIQYLISGSYNRETSVFPGSFSDTKSNAHINLNNSSANQKFHFQVSASYTADNNRLPRTDLTEIALLLPPNAPPLYTEDGALNWALNATGTSTWVNPLAAPFYKTYRTKTNVLVANPSVSYQLLKGLKIAASLGYTNLQSTDLQTNKLVAEKPEQRQFTSRSANYGTGSLNTWIFEPQITYYKNISKGKLDVLVGSTFQRSATEAGYFTGNGYNNDEVLENPQAAASLFSGGYSINLYKYYAVFGRINYNWKNKYILNLSSRRDGSSRFGTNAKFHNFGAIGAAWIFTEEQLIKNSISFLSFGKIKANYGTTGSDQIGDYRFLSLYNTVTPGIAYQGTTGLSPSDIPNPNLEWEETKKLNLGIDLGVLNDRIIISGNYSRNRSSNQLLDYNLPRITGRNNVLQNFPATVENTNWEVSLTTTNLKNKKLNWSSAINLTISRNKLVDFPNLASSAYKNSLIVGEPINVQRAYPFLGVDPTSGLYIVADSHGVPTSSPTYPDDATVLITTFPKFYGGFQNSLRYKNFEIDVLFQFVKQKGASAKFSNIKGYAPGMFFGNFNGTGNQPINVVNRWQKPGDVTTVQKFTATDSDVDSKVANALSSDAYYEDASFARLKNLSVSWEIPNNWKQKAHLQYFKLYMQGQNLFTITNYSGLDPENQSFFSIPPLRVLTVGLRVGF